MHVAHQIEGTTEGGGCGGDTRVYELLVGQLVLWTCCGRNLAVDLCVGCNAGSFLGVDVVGILSLSSTGAGLFSVDVALKRGVGIAACQCLAVDVLLKGMLLGLGAGFLSVDVVLQGLLSTLRTVGFSSQVRLRCGGVEDVLNLVASLL